MCKTSVNSKLWVENSSLFQTNINSFCDIDSMYFLFVCEAIFWDQSIHFQTNLVAEELPSDLRQDGEAQTCTGQKENRSSMHEGIQKKPTEPGKDQEL